MTDHDFAQRAVLAALLRAHPRMLGLDELTAQLTDVPRAREAFRVLVGDGLATQLGDRVGVSRAAVRFDALSPVEQARPDRRDGRPTSPSVGRIGSPNYGRSP